MVDTSALSNVLIVDVQNKTVLVEPNVPMDALIEATLQLGLIPPVVMEFPGITVGGAFAGTAGESSSFRYGFFDRIINRIEMVLGDGEVVKASKTEKSDLFYGAASSFGTLGVTTLLELQLIEAKHYVALTYHPVSSISEAQVEIEKGASDISVDYLDGIMFAQDSGVICVGRLTNEVRKDIKIQGFSKATDPWFYIHAERLLQKRTTPITEAIPLVDYLFRYDRGGFWVARYAYKYFITPFNRITRWILDYFMHTSMCILPYKIHRSCESREQKPVPRASQGTCNNASSRNGSRALSRLSCFPFFTILICSRSHVSCPAPVETLLPVYNPRRRYPVRPSQYLHDLPRDQFQEISNLALSPQTKRQNSFNTLPPSREDKPQDAGNDAQFWSLGARSKQER
jgi:hypothetical protein